MAFVKSNDKFFYVNIVAEGSDSAGGAFRDTSLFKAIKNDRSLPEAETLPGGSPYCIVIRKLLLNMIKPSPQWNMTRKET